MSLKSSLERKRGKSEFLERIERETMQEQEEGVFSERGESDVSITMTMTNERMERGERKWTFVGGDLSKDRLMAGEEKRGAIYTDFQRQEEKKKGEEGGSGGDWGTKEGDMQMNMNKIRGFENKKGPRGDMDIYKKRIVGESMMENIYNRGSAYDECQRINDNKIRNVERSAENNRLRFDGLEGQRNGVEREEIYAKGDFETDIGKEEDEEYIEREEENGQTSKGEIILGGIESVRSTYGRQMESQADFDIDRCCSTSLKGTSQGSSSLVSSSAWLYYQDEYVHLRQTLSTVYSAFNNMLLSKCENRPQLNECLNLEPYISKDCLLSFIKYLSPKEDSELERINFDLLLYKLWKKHYCTLLDSLDILYKDCQLLIKVKNNQNEILNKSTIDDFKTTFSEFLFGGNVDYVIQKSSLGFKVSTTFLTDIISQCRIFRGELERQNSIKDRLFYILKTAKEQRSKLKTYVTNLRNDLKSLLCKMKVVNTNETDWILNKSSNKIHIQLSIGEKQDYQKRIEDLERILKEEETRRKKLHNRLQELIGNIRVYCRIRPQPNSFLKTTSEDKLIVMGDCLPEKITKHWYGKDSKCFIFDRVFGSKVDQVGVFESVEELITSCVDGYNVCIMAYGQTGSGKTHTMMGTVSEPGVNRRAIQKLLDICNSRNQWNYCLFLSMVEIYQEDVRDLLSERHAVSVKIMSNQDNEIMLHGLTEHQVKCENDIFRYFDIGERNRKVASTLLNITSSRSHLIVLLKVYGENKIHLTRSVGTLTLCDLAGSENVTKSGATGERFSEATCINKSLTTLGRVFDSLRKHQKPSYRETKLTYLLKPTLGGDSKCLLFINVRCEPENAEESLRALHFGINAMQVAPEKAQQRSKFRKTLGKITM